MDSSVRWGGIPKLAAPDFHRGPHALAARHRPDYPLSGCFPAEPNSVSSGAAAYHDDQQRLKAMPQRTLESMPLKIVCKEKLCSRWEVASRSRMTGSGCKSAEAAAVKSCRGERSVKRRESITSDEFRGVERK
jgi:hypothetical protein